jgi:predicted dehydrogenase
VVGNGSIGKRHIQNLLSISNYNIIISTKQRKPKSLNKKRCIFVKSLNEGLQYNPSIGFVTNVSSEHIQTSLLLAKAGCHIFIEKPLSNSLKETEKLLNMVKKEKLVTLMGCNLRFHSCIKKIKSLIEQKTIGEIISVKSECGTYLPEWHPNENYSMSYAARDDLGGGVVLTCIHEIDYLYWFFGEIKEVFSITGKFSDLKIKSSDLSAIILKFKNNIIGEIHLDYFQRPEFRSCKIIGTKGTIYWDSTNNEVKLFDIKKKKWITKLKVKNYDKNKQYVDELSHFLNCVKMKKKSINDLTQGIKTLKIALTTIKSSKEKKLVKIIS